MNSGVISAVTAESESSAHPEYLLNTQCRAAGRALNWGFGFRALEGGPRDRSYRWGSGPDRAFPFLPQHWKG